MRISVIPAVLALMLCAALTYLTHYIGRDDENCALLTIGTATSLILTLGITMAANVQSGRMSVNLKVWSGAMSLLALICALCFAGFGVHVPTYVLMTTLLLVVHLLVVWKIATAKDV